MDKRKEAVRDGLTFDPARYEHGLLRELRTAESMERQWRSEVERLKRLLDSASETFPRPIQDKP